MKKLLSVSVAVFLLAIVLSLGSFGLTANAETEGYYTFTVSNGEATITDVDTSISGDVVIPETLGGCPVTAIAKNAFEDCTSLTSVTIPNSVTNIGERAFADCESLANVTIPNSVTSIGKYAFSSCKSLTNVTIPDSVTSILDRTFSSCENLTHITIPDSVTSISNIAFQYSNNVIIYCNKSSYAAEYAISKMRSYVYIDGTDEENTVSGKIGNFEWSVNKRTGVLEFAGAGNMADFSSSTTPPWYEYRMYITSVKLPNTMTEIGNYAFYRCVKLTDITIPGNITSIGEGAFAECTKLANVTISDGVTSIGDRAFSKCTNLTGIMLPNSVTSIGEWAFEDCDSLTSVTIPDNVTIIDYYVFGYCDNLESVVIGDGATEISHYAFCGCSSLKNITMGDGVTRIGTNAFWMCSGLTDITIGDSVTEIDYWAFRECTSLETITIPKSVIEIESKVFLDCKALKNVIVYSENCKFDSDCGLNYNQTIYGFTGSTAEAFAAEIGAEFIDIMTIHTHKLDSSGACKECGLEVIKITSQPKTAYTELGEKAKFTVKAKGEGLKYQWYYKDADGTKYKKCSGTKSSYSLEMTEARKDRKLYCVVTDKDGNEVKSKTVYMRMAALIKTEPKTQYTQLGEKAKFTVKAVGDGLKYQWYYKSAGSSKYKKADCTKSSYTITMTEDRRDRKFYCVITDKYGNKVQTKTITMKLAASIKTEPKSVKTSIGKKATFTVKAVGDGLKYQWYYKDTDGKKYKKASCTKATYSIELTKARNGRKFYCVVTDKYGNEVKTKTVSMKKK